MGKNQAKKRKDAAKVELSDYVLGDEVQIVKVLTACGLLDKAEETFWRWKHLNRPGFSPSHVKKAHLGKKTVGCFHYAMLPLKVDEKLEIPVCFGGDSAVLPKYRGLGTPKQAYDEMNRRVREHDQVVFHSGFSSRELYERFYARLGQVLIPTVSIEYTKIIGIGALKHKVEEIGQKVLTRSSLRKKFQEEPLIVELIIDNLPPCHLELTGQGFYLHEGNAQQSHLKVRMPYSLLIKLTRGPVTLVKATSFNLLCGRLRIRGLLKNSWTLLSLLWSSLFD